MLQLTHHANDTVDGSHTSHITLLRLFISVMLVTLLCLLMLVKLVRHTIYASHAGQNTLLTQMMQVTLFILVMLPWLLALFMLVMLVKILCLLRSCKSHCSPDSTPKPDTWYRDCATYYFACEMPIKWPWYRAVCSTTCAAYDAKMGKPASCNGE